MVKNLRIYGKAPFSIALIHGGPGAAGEMAPVARDLASNWGVLEPLQTAKTLDGQVEELRAVLAAHGDLPIILIGFSWGAWLGFLLAAKYPQLVKKLILVGSGSFEEEYSTKIQETRLNRLAPEERKEIESLMEILNSPKAGEKNAAFKRFGAMMEKADAYDPETLPAMDLLDVRQEIFQGVWEEAAELRRSGGLLELGKYIRCPVTAIHGDYDPHPAEGVRKPLSTVLKDFRFILLENCGHKPWIERRAKKAFFIFLRDNCSPL